MQLKELVTARAADVKPECRVILKELLDKAAKHRLLDAVWGYDALFSEYDQSCDSGQIRGPEVNHDQPLSFSPS